MSETTHDNALFEILKECKNLPTFFDAVFGFLHRRTDFYHVSDEPNCPIGLPQGLAETLVRKAYLKWAPQHSGGEISVAEDVPEALYEEEVIAEETVDDQLDNLSLEPKSEFSPADYYNGAMFDSSYCWSQSIKEVYVLVKLTDTVKAKDMRVEIQPNKISIKHKEELILEGDLGGKCRHSDAIWSIERGKLQIHLDKVKELWWDCLFTSEPKLDVTKLDCTRPFDELTEEAQAKIEELDWNQKRKRLGLSTSDEMVQNEVLRKAWNAEGSPFSGPFDPSKVSFS